MLSSSLHIFFDSYAANAKNINVTTIKTNVIIQFTKQLQEKLWEGINGRPAVFSVKPHLYTSSRLKDKPLRDTDQWSPNVKFYDKRSQK